MNQPEPTGARFIDDRVFAISWTDGTTLHYAPEPVRAACPCAHCVSDRKAKEDRAPETHSGVRLTKLDEVGRYAFQLSFSDGHALGIYPYDQLYGLGHAPGAVPTEPTTPDGFAV